jgi:hypothetical protein
MRRYLAFALLLTAGTLSALENDLSRAFYHRLGIFPDNPRIPVDIKQAMLTGRQSAAWTATYADLYRFRDPDGTHAAIDAMGTRIRLIQPFPGRQGVLSIDGTVYQDRGFLSGFNRYIAADPRSMGGRIAGALYLPGFPAGIGLNAGGEYKSSGSDGKLQVRRYPSAAGQADLNTYLFDLLGQTFGQTLTYGHDVRTRAGTVQAEQGPWFLYARYQQSDRTIAWTYANTESTKLAGTKHTDFSTLGHGLAVRGGGTLMLRPAHRLTGALAYWRKLDELAMVPRNPTQRSDGMYLDLRDWGGARMDQAGWGGMAGWEWALDPFGGIQAAVQWGDADFEGSGTLKTPVLGFTYGLPIGHEFSGTMRGTILSQYYQCGGESRPGQKYFFNARLGYLHTVIAARVAGRAGMEFNVATTPVDADYEFTGNVFDGKLEGGMQITRKWKIGVAIYQIVPIFKRTKEERHVGPLPGPVSGEKTQRATRGGTEYSVNMDYLF